MIKKGVGGFFGLEIPQGADGILHYWIANRQASYFSNARSALSALIASEQPGAVWLPAFLCTSLADAVPISLQRYYPVGETLSPQVLALSEVKNGDMLIGINYFGYPRCCVYLT